MSYEYAKFRPAVLTDEGQRNFLKVRDAARKLFQVAGACRADKLLIITGDSWENVALVDRMVELGEIRCLNDSGMWQNRVYVPVGDWWK